MNFRNISICFVAVLILATLMSINRKVPDQTYVVSEDCQTFFNRDTKEIYHYADKIGFYQVVDTGIVKIKKLP
jgi:hypothetical protein